MAIRDTWHRMVRKSFSSSSSTARSDDGEDVTAAPAALAGTSPTPNVPLSKTSSRLTGNLSKITSWRSNASHNRHATGSNGSNGSAGGAKGSGDSSSRKASPKRDSPPKSILKKSGGSGGGFGSAFPKKLHPSERPLTEQNLRHQEMLGTFTMKFGRSRRFSRGNRSSFSGISPRCSVDSSAGAGWGADDDDAVVGCLGHRRMSSAAVAPDEARIAEESS